ncbi:hypothetical protein X743_31330 [Mesorhizobium sp. LNHC252B00]|nr:hypothetical protein X743_31330 [Mesorhizobium sp. LNHC252B00]
MRGEGIHDLIDFVQANSALVWDNPISVSGRTVEGRKSRAISAVGVD